MILHITTSHMRHYDTSMNVSYIYPYTKHKPYRQKQISAEAQKRLKWMDYIDSGKTVAECARHFDYPYSTIKYWKDRYNRKDLSTLENKSKRPHKVRKCRLTKQDEMQIHDARVYELPGAGKVTLQKYIENEYGIKYGQQQIQGVIKKFKLTRVKRDGRKKPKHKNRQHMYTVPKKMKKQPGGLVYLDVKHLRFGRSKWYQFTALDQIGRASCRERVCHRV